MRDHSGARAPQLPIELILLRQVASYLDLPVFLIDAGGALVYFNVPAEPLLSLRFDEVGELSMTDWLARFRPGDEAGRALTADAVPLVAALHEVVSIAAEPHRHRRSEPRLDGSRLAPRSCPPCPRSGTV